MKALESQAVCFATVPVWKAFVRGTALCHFLYFVQLNFCYIMYNSPHLWFRWFWERKYTKIYMNKIKWDKTDLSYFMPYGSAWDSLKSMEKFLWFSMVGLDLIKKYFYLQCSVCLKSKWFSKPRNTQLPRQSVVESKCDSVWTVLGG